MLIQISNIVYKGKKWFVRIFSFYAVTFIFKMRENSLFSHKSPIWLQTNETKMENIHICWLILVRRLDEGYFF